MTGDRRPIGYWLKHLDRLIDERFDATIGDQGLTRRHWQLLDLVAGGPAGQQELAAALAPFVSDSPVEITAVIDDLTVRGWFERNPGSDLSITAAGVAAHRAISERVAATRRRLARGISGEDYRATIDVLQRMSANLLPHAGGDPCPDDCGPLSSHEPA